MSKNTSPPIGFILGVGISLALHGYLLFVLQFKMPEAISQAAASALDVILVNKKSLFKPTNAQAKAQVNSDGGGNTDEDRRIATPLPPSQQKKDGNDLVDAQRRVAELEAMQKQLLAAQKKSKQKIMQAERRPDAK